jgi:hypothetical protein
MARSFQSQFDEARIAGERDADQETSAALWFIAGCGVGALGVVGAYVISPNPSASKLLGKSPEYVAAYTDAYKEKAKSIQTKNAWIGCGTFTVLYIIYVVAVVSAASSS